MLGFFVKPCLTQLKYHAPSHLPDDLSIGDSTAALAVYLSDSEGEILNEFCKGVVQFYQHFMQKLLQKFDFKSQLLHVLSFLDPVKCKGIKQCTSDQLGDILQITFDKDAVKMEHREFVVDSDIDCAEGNATKFCVDKKSPIWVHINTRILPLLPSSFCLFVRLMQTVNRIRR